MTRQGRCNKRDKTKIRLHSPYLVNWLAASWPLRVWKKFNLQLYLESNHISLQPRQLFTSYTNIFMINTKYMSLLNSITINHINITKIVTTGIWIIQEHLYKQLQYYSNLENSKIIQMLWDAILLFFSHIISPHLSLWDIPIPCLNPSITLII